MPNLIERAKAKVASWWEEFWGRDDENPRDTMPPALSNPITILAWTLVVGFVVAALHGLWLIAEGLWWLFSALVQILEWVLA
ncbi:MAG: hypothetical protein KBC46_03295 [Ferrovibrio sp.]|nr:hypothetical protein [Ferrovibrio sp.]